ncbi:MAG: PAS domain-containing protein [Alphaproteobacteria bacterium]|nr:PAS domain-containing protein [Alphaproteobacteria bacterium]HPF45606.1 PAS domain-containing protein [Emcibacteraceae bacterium]HRW29027.1 PAS domain-containing protein [Emcibacteraceae bacterium]
MSKTMVTPRNEEITLSDGEIIVSKTDLKGEIKYVNDTFCRVAEMSVDEIINQPHSIIRHPDMPRSIFHYLWRQIASKKEIFAYVKNMSKSGKFYWVFAHVTPTLDRNGEITGYHSSRRKADPDKISAISDMYRKLLEIENRPQNRKEGLEAAVCYLEEFFKSNNTSYDEFIWSVGK